MNCSCNDTSCVIPIGNPGTNGSNGVATNGVNGTPENVAFDTSLNISFTTTASTGTIFTLGYLIFPGTTNLDITPNKCYIVSDVIVGRWTVTILNGQNQIVCSSPLITSITPTLYDLGTLTNLSLNVDIFTIQATLNVNGGGTNQININALTLDLG